ncbi:MAG: DUF5989 family protein [Planctomycetota bacterium]
MRAVNIVLSILMSFAVAVLVLEGGLRFLGLGPTPSIQRFDSKLGWSKTPLAVARRDTREFDVTYRVNELGLRDDPMSSPAKPANTLRVLMLGDSFVLGYTVDREHLFVDQLERWWKAEGRTVDVINAGTEGYSTDQEALWLAEHGRAFAPDVVLAFPYENDLYWNAQPSYLRFPKPRIQPDGTPELRELVDPGKKSALESTALGGLLSKFARGEKPPMWSPGSASDHGGARPLPAEWAAYFGDSSAQAFMQDANARTRGALTHLKKTCGELGAQLVVVPIPGKACIQDEALAALEKVIGSSANPAASTGSSGWSPARPVETFLGLCRELDIQALDARPALKAAAAEDGDLYFPIDWHFNGTGNRAFAEFVHDALDATHVFPAAFSATRTVSLPHEPKVFRVPTFVYVYLVLWAIVSTLYALTYRDEPMWRAPLQVGVMLALVFGIVLGGKALVGRLPAQLAMPVFIVFFAGVLTFVLIKLGRRLGTISELFLAFTRRGHWYLMPLVVVLLTVGSLLVVAASSPLVAPFIYTLF